MINSQTGSQRGSGLFELLMALIIGATAIAAGLTVISSADRLSTGSRMRMRATAQYRTSHAAIGLALQSAAIDSLDGFDVLTGEATDPEYQLVTGMTDGEVTYSRLTSLSFVRDKTTIPGIGKVGRVVMSSVGEPDEVLAANVVDDSFRVRQEGRSLVVRLKTYYLSGNEDPVIMEGETVVSLRN
jgi:hypothetical protein